MWSREKGLSASNSAALPPPGGAALCLLPPHLPSQGVGYGGKLNTHLARITSCPSKIFHYPNIRDVEGTVTAKTLQDWLSVLSAARVSKSAAEDCM